MLVNGRLIPVRQHRRLGISQQTKAIRQPCIQIWILTMDMV